MISARNFVTLISWALLSAAPLVCAQAVKPTGPVQLALLPQPGLAFTLQPDLVSAPLAQAQDLSRYRGFQFGMSLLAVAKQADKEPSEAKALHARPALIQEMGWRPLSSVGSAFQDPVREVLFSFYNDALFQMVVNYDDYRTEGLRDEDMIEAISAKYGTATGPDAKVIVFSTSQVYNDSEVVIARWEDSQYSFNLSVPPTNRPLECLFSKRLHALAQTAIAEAIRLDEQEAPVREIERQKSQEEENRAVGRPSTLDARQS
jgi:hypothetical protein